MFFWISFKIIIVLLLLIAFLRRPSFTWGIGLLAATTAVLLDTFLGTFGREEMMAELGFFFYIIAGALVGSTAVWIWGWLRPYTAVASNTAIATTATPTPRKRKNDTTAFDRQMLFEEIRTRFSPEDIRDLIFDLGINENDVIAFQQDTNTLIVNLMDTANEQGQTGALALAVERILTPMPPENLPRLEKIDADSPPTILRHYLLAHYTLADLQAITESLAIDWEQLESSSKKAKVRSLLLYLYRRNRVHELIAIMKKDLPVADPLTD